MNDAAKQAHWDAVYDRPLENIPWEIIEPPKELVELIETKQITDGDALDLACGTGNYSFYLARHGFMVTGVDFSDKALNIAREHAKSLQLPVTFINADITQLDEVLHGQRFDFILDYSILHHLEPTVIEQYANQCARLLKPDGKLLIVCYSDTYDDEDVTKTGKTGAGKYGNSMFFRTKEEIRAAYHELREIWYRKGRLGKRAQHPAHCFLFEK